MASRRNTIEYVEGLAAGLPAPAAIDALITALEPLVQSLAARYQQAALGVEIDDLEQVARIGLLHACRTFDRSRGAFPAHAQWSIRGEIKNYLRDQGRPVRLPERVIDQLPRMQRETQRLSQALLREPTVEELARALVLKETVVVTIFRYLIAPVELDAPATIKHHDGVSGEEPRQARQIIDKSTPEDILIAHETVARMLQNGKGKV